MRKLLLYLFFCFLSFLIFGQQESDLKDSYSKEWIYGFNKNTRGGLIGGIFVRHNQAITDNYFASYGVSLANIQHPSEKRYTSQAGTGGKFIFGKANYLYAIRLQYGREKRLYQKASKQGVQINVSVAAGPTIGIVSPYYIINAEGEYEPFDQTLHPSPQVIISHGRLLQGFGQSKVIPGAHLKGSMIFEFGAFQSNIIGIETGFMIEGFVKKISIVPTKASEAFYPNLFFSLFWGFRN